MMPTNGQDEETSQKTATTASGTKLKLGAMYSNPITETKTKLQYSPNTLGLGVEECTGALSLATSDYFSAETNGMSVENLVIYNESGER